MGRIIDYPEISSFLDDDYLIVDGATGSTRKILGQTVVGVTDPEPIEDSTNPVQSGGVYNALDEIASDIDDLREDAYSIYPTKAASSTDTDPIVSIEDAADDTPLKRMLAYIVPSMSGSGVPSKTNIRNFKVVSNLELYRTAKNMINPYNMFQESPTKVLLGVTQSNEKIFLKSGTYTINVRNTSGERLTAKWEVQDIADIYTSNTIVLNEDGFVSIYVEDDSGISRSDIRTGFTLAPGEEALAYGTSNSGKYETTISFPYDRPVYLGTLDLVKGELLVTGFLFHRNSSQMNNTEDEPGWKDIGVYGGRLTPGTVNVKRYWAGPANRVRYTYVNVGQKYVVRANGNGYDIILPKADYNYTQSQWISAAIDVQIIVPYSTPISYTIDPLELRTISGYNRYFTDSGNVALTYCINLNTFVNGKIDPEISNLDNKIDGVDARLTSEISEAEEAIDNVSERTTAIEDTFPTGTASGSVARFVDDISGIPVKSCIAQIEPKQDLHGYDHPWPGGGGVNLAENMSLSLSDLHGITVNAEDDGTITINGTSQGTSYIRGYFHCPDQTATYTWAVFNAAASTDLEFSVRNSRYNPAGGWAPLRTANMTLTFTIDSGETADYWQFAVKDGATINNVTLKPIIVSGSTAPTSYSPYSNICPISGWTGANVVRTGKNLANSNALIDKGCVEQADGSLYVDDPAKIFKVKVFENSNYTGQITITFVYKYSSDENGRKGVVPTINYTDGTHRVLGVSANTEYTTLTVVSDSSKIVDNVDFTYNSSDVQTWFYLQLELGSTATEYEPYSGDTYSITFPSEAGTVYGGELDVTNGVLTVDRAIKVFDGVNNTVSSVSVSMATGNYFCVLPLSGAIANSTNLLSNMLKNDGTQIANLGNIYILSNGNAVGVLPDQTLTTAAAVNSWLAQNNIQLFYELATPITYTLTPTEIKSLLGDNNIWADTGDIDVTYRINPHTYIEEKLLTLYPTDTVTGSATHFPDGADDIPVKSCVVDVLPNQDLHGYDHPWPGGGGVNLLYVPTGRTYTENGVTWTLNQNGSITVSGTATEASTFRYIQQEIGEAFNGDYYFQCFPAISTSIFSSGVLIGGAWFSVYANEKTALTGLSGKIQQMWFQVRAGQTLNTTFYPMIYKASETVTEWSPYSNICPISGWTGAQVMRTGVNIWDEEWEQGAIISGETPYQASNVIRSKNFCPIKGGETYFLTSPKTDGGNQNIYYVFVSFYDENKNFISRTPSNNLTFTAPNNACYFKIATNTSTVVYGGTYNHDISINYPATDTDYHPYAGDTYSITFPSEAGTVYGGTLDATNGTLTVDRAMVDLGTLTWKKDSSQYSFYSNTSPLFGSGGTALARSTAKNVCENYKHDTVTLSDPVNGRFCVANSQEIPILRLSDNGFNDAQSLETALDGVKAVFELYTPVTYHLTPTEIKTLLGDNTIFADCGDTTVNYRADTGLFITKKLGG